MFYQEEATILPSSQSSSGEATKRRMLELYQGRFQGQTSTRSTSNFSEDHALLTCDYISPDLFDTASHFTQYPSYGPQITLSQKRQERARQSLALRLQDSHYTWTRKQRTIPGMHYLGSRWTYCLRDKLLRKIQLFLSLGVDLNLPNKEGELPLVASIRGRPSLRSTDHETGAQRSKYLEFLVWKDPHARGRVPNLINVNICDIFGASTLYYAALSGRPECVKSLVERGTNGNARLGGAQPISILQAAYNAKDAAITENDPDQDRSFQKCNRPPRRPRVCLSSDNYPKTAASF